MNDPEKEGLIPRMISQCFSKIAEMDCQLEFIIKASYCEIYNEKIKDLVNSEYLQRFHLNVSSFGKKVS